MRVVADGAASCSLTCAGHGLGPVDHEGVDVVQLEVLQGLQQVGLHVLRPVVPVPQLSLDEEVLSLDDPLGKQLLQGLPYHVLVVVVVGAVDGPVASLDCRDDGLLRLLCGRLPSAETQSGHLAAIIEGDVEIVHLRSSLVSSSLV